MEFLYNNVCHSRPGCTDRNLLRCLFTRKLTCTSRVLNPAVCCGKPAANHQNYYVRRKAYKILIGKTSNEETTSEILGDNIKMNPMEVGYESVDDSVVSDMTHC